MDGGVMLVVGLSHQTTPLAAREQAALDDGRARTVLRALRADAAIHEAVVLSTCNRTEIYAVAGALEDGEAAMRRALKEHTSVGAATLSCSAYVLSELGAVEHLLRVAAGLESAILGETGIGGQVREAARRAREEGTLGQLLAGVFDLALTAARRVRRRTGISVGGTTVASVVADLVHGARPAAVRHRTVLIGAGRLAQSLAGALAAVPGAELVVLNRTAAGAASVARRHGASAAGLDRLGAELRRSDAIVCAADAPQPLVSAAAVRDALDGLRRPLLVIDLAVPRAVEPAVAALPDVALHDIDAVQRLVSRNVAVRRREAEVAGEMVRQEAERFAGWRRELDAAPLVRAVWRQAEDLRRNELERAIQGLSAEERDRLDRVTASVVRKLLHGPAERLRAACATSDAAAHLETFRMLFDVGAGGAPDSNIVGLPQREAA